jgi:hypothetical protein
MTIDTTKLRELAQNATPGEWDANRHLVFTGAGVPEWIIANVRSGNAKNDADYIAAANPATVLALLDDTHSALRSSDVRTNRYSIKRIAMTVVRLPP